MTQTYHYMVEAGLEYGYLTKGDAVVFLKMYWDRDPTVLLLHYLARPLREVAVNEDPVYSNAVCLCRTSSGWHFCRSSSRSVWARLICGRCARSTSKTRPSFCLCTPEKPRILLVLLVVLVLFMQRDKGQRLLDDEREEVAAPSHLSASQRVQLAQDLAQARDLFT